MGILKFDQFTVGSSIALLTYDTTYERSDANGGVYTVNEALDAVTLDAANVDCLIWWNAYPTENYIVSLQGNRNVNAFEGPSVWARVDGNIITGYTLTPNGTNLELYRVVDSAWGSPLWSGTLGSSTSYKLGLKVKGTNPVEITVYLNDVALTTYSDSNAARRQAGGPGFQIYQSAASTNNRVDDFKVESIESFCAWDYRPDAQQIFHNPR